MGRDEYGNKDLVLLLIGVGSIILAFLSPILGIIAGLLGIIFARKARRIHETKMNSLAVILSLLGLIVGLGTVVFNMALFQIINA